MIDEEPRGAWTSLQHRDFRLLWLGQGISTAGSQMRVVAINYQIFKLTGSALALGMVGLCRFIPLVVLALGSGLLADRFDRRRTMMATQSCMMFCSAALAWWTLQGHITATEVYVLVTLTAMANTFDMPARQSLIPALVPRHRLQNALSLNVLIWQTATVVGPTIGGYTIARLGIAAVYVVDALSFLAVLTSLLLMRYRAVPAPPESAPVTWRSALDGLHFVRRNPLIFSTMWLDFAANLFGSASTMLPIFADQVLKVGAEGLGWLYAAPSLGAVIGATWVARISPLSGQGPKILVAVVVYGLCTAGFGLSHSFPLTLFFLAGTGAADSISAVVRSTMRQLLTPDELRGRMTAVNMLFFAGGPQLGEAEAGVAAHWMGLGPSVALGGLACVAVTMGIARLFPQLKTFDR